MSFIFKLTISLITAAIATVAVTRFQIEGTTQLGMVFAVATTLTAFLSNLSFSFSLPSLSLPSLGSDREHGQVKWFNAGKGFGFIVRENGEEIFVHFRSIKSKDNGRRSLRDGQDVSFVVRDNDKGPQAEDVEAT